MHRTIPYSILYWGKHIWKPKCQFNVYFKSTFDKGHDNIMQCSNSEQRENAQCSDAPKRHNFHEALWMMGIKSDIHLQSIFTYIKTHCITFMIFKIYINLREKKLCILLDKIFVSPLIFMHFYYARKMLIFFNFIVAITDILAVIIFQL